MARRTRGYFRDNQRGIEEILGKRTTDFAESGSDNTLKTKSSQSGTRVELEATGDDSNINIAIVPKGSGKVQIADAYYMPTADGSADQVIKTDGAGNLSFGDGGSTLGDLTAVGSTLLSPSNADLTLTTAGTGDVRLEGINVVLGYHGGVSVENMIVATGTSNRHVKSLANNVVDEMLKVGIKPHGVEGLTDGEWVLVDLVDVVVHVMLAQTRKFYEIERLWSMSAESRAARGDQA